MTDVGKLIAEARFVVERNGMTQSTILIDRLADALEATAAELRERTWQFEDAEVVREDNARLAEDAEAERDRYRDAIEKAREVNEKSWRRADVRAILTAALDETEGD